MRKYIVHVYLEQYNKFKGRKQKVIATSHVEIPDSDFDRTYKERDTFVYARVREV